jgi:DNA repair exonuclease SbcCD nuclease subunit
VRLFDSFLSRAVASVPALVVVAIPGNHDSAARLSFGTQIMSRLGGTSSESERSFVGMAEQVDASSFAAFDYVALGHLHRFQAVGPTGRYAGSPLAYSFAEGSETKGFVLVDLKAEDGFEARLLPVAPLARDATHRGAFLRPLREGSRSQGRARASALVPSREAGR